MFEQNDLRSSIRKNTKTKYGIIIISVAIGLACWVIDTVLDRMFFYDGTFLELLITAAPKHEIYIRTVILSSFMIFGILMAKIISRRIYVEEELKAANQQLQANNQQLRASHEEISVLARFPSENPNPVLRIGNDGIIIYSNEAGLSLLRDWSAQVGSRLPEKWRKFSADVFSSGSKKETEFEYCDNVFSLTFVPIVDLDYVNIYALDITKRKQAEDKLHEYQAKLKAMASQLSSIQERERRKLAVEMHDRVTQKLSMVKLGLETSACSFKDDNASREVKGIAEQIGETIEDAYSLMLELSNPILYEIGLKAAVEALLRSDLIKGKGIKSRLVAQKDPLKLGTEVSVALYQGVREALTNVVKHARAKNVEVKIQNESDIIRITIVDDGIGFDPLRTKAPGRKGGFGLFSIRESLEGLGGELTVKPKSTNGTSVILTMPT